jgi:hypothetical protein
MYKNLSIALLIVAFGLVALPPPWPAERKASFIPYPQGEPQLLDLAAIVFLNSAADPLNKFLNTATSAAIPVCSAGSTSGANEEEWFDGSIVPAALAWANFSGSAPPRLK